MKFIKRTTLAFSEANGNKVYEIDLCEQLSDLEQRFLVNFRHYFADVDVDVEQGTKTPLAVNLQTAESLFNAFITSKVSEGYLEQSNQEPSAKSHPNSLRTLYENAPPQTRHRIWVGGAIVVILGVLSVATFGLAWLLAK